MKSLAFEIVTQDAQNSSETLRIVFSKHPDALHGRHVTEARMEAKIGGRFKMVATQTTRLGKDDAYEGRYNFFAGSRISFERLIAFLRSIGWTEDLLSGVRRAITLELSIEENAERFRALAEEQSRLANQRRLLIEKRREIGITPNPLPEMLRPRFPGKLFGKPVVFGVDQASGCDRTVHSPIFPIVKGFDWASFIDRVERNPNAQADGDGGQR